MAAAGEPLTWRLQWRQGPRASTCIGAQALRRLVRQRLGRDPFVGHGLTLDGEVRRLPRAWQVELRILDEAGTVQGRRELVSRSPSCRGLDRAIVLLTVLAVDTGALGSAPEPGPVANPEPAPVPVANPGPVPVANPGPAPALTRRTPPPPSPPWHPALAVAGVLELGTLPHPAPGVALQLVTGWPRRAPLVLDAALWPRSQTDAAGGSARFWLSTVALGTRPSFALTRRLRLALAAALELGWLHGQGNGFDSDLGSTQTLVALRGDAALHLRLGRGFYLGLRLGLGALLRRQPFYVEEPERRTVHRPWPVSLRGGLLVGLEL